MKFKYGDEVIVLKNELSFYSGLARVTRLDDQNESLFRSCGIVAVEFPRGEYGTITQRVSIEDIVPSTEMTRIIYGE